MRRPLLKLWKVPRHPGSESVMFCMFVMETLDTPATKCLLTVSFTGLLTRSHLDKNELSDFLDFCLRRGRRRKDDISPRLPKRR